LKERIEDIPLLFRKFAIDFSEKYRTPNLQLDEQAIRMLQSYQWPGNIRELRNLVGQMSILSEDKFIHGDDVLHYIPALLKRNLPQGPISAEGEKTTFQEREILYKLLFEMKHDLNELKNLIFELIRNNNLRVPDVAILRHLQSPSFTSNSPRPDFDAIDDQQYEPVGSYDNYHDNSAKPLIVTNTNDKSFSNMEVVEENLSIEEMEKELILKALKKHNNRRKEAADDLGISERTLYRKIKQYDL
jgi:DNA-binding NtrC family response regulator